MDSATPAAQAFVDALVWLDFVGLKATLEPNLKFRALVPGRFSLENQGGFLFRKWRKLFSL
jgi:hypothetical protein